MYPWSLLQQQSQMRKKTGCQTSFKRYQGLQPVLSIYRKSVEASVNLFFQVTGLIWSHDLRVQEVRRLLQSSRPVRVNVVQLPEVSDHEYIEEKENKWVSHFSAKLIQNKWVFVFSPHRKKTFWKWISFPSVELCPLLDSILGEIIWVLPVIMGGRHLLSII